MTPSPRCEWNARNFLWTTTKVSFGYAKEVSYIFACNLPFCLHGFSYSAFHYKTGDAANDEIIDDVYYDTSPDSYATPVLRQPIGEIFLSRSDPLLVPMIIPNQNSNPKNINKEQHNVLENPSNYQKIFLRLRRGRLPIRFGRRRKRFLKPSQAKATQEMFLRLNFAFVARIRVIFWKKNFEIFQLPISSLIFPLNLKWLNF